MCDEQELYEGQVCQQALQDIQSCIPGTENCSRVYIPSTGGKQQDLEEHARKLIVLGLQLLQPSPQCEEDAASLLCLYIFKLCDSNGTLYQPLASECEMVRSYTCVLEWKTTEMFLGTTKLPDCATLPAESALNCQNGLLLLYK